ncbi:MAG: hypothetical protein Ta2F_04660 [Termitinemataceae bacterium]|nr:MAG: hypothetical protein Ta2F_04660 [Termitinemataceae bacterium]
MGLLDKCETILYADAKVSGLPKQSSVQLNEFTDIQDLFSDGFLAEHSFGEPIQLPEDYPDIMPEFKIPVPITGNEFEIPENIDLNSQKKDNVLEKTKIQIPYAPQVEMPNTEKPSISTESDGLDGIEVPDLMQTGKTESGYQGRRRGNDRSDRRRNTRATGNQNTLTVMDLRKNFGKKEVVRGVGFSMKGGDVAGLLGPNGAGKTTIFYMIVGFYKPTTGDIKLNDISITSGPMYRRARMGIAYLPQEASIFRKLTVEQNIWAILESRIDINKKAKRDKLEQLIDDFGIHRIRKQFGYTLSGGERRRTEIARALAIEPKFLLLDEPFAGIDPIAVFEIKQIIKHLAEEGIGILITDHNVRDTLEITTDAFIINRGVIVARGDRENILANQTVRDVYLGSDFKM